MKTLPRVLLFLLLIITPSSQAQNPDDSELRETARSALLIVYLDPEGPAQVHLRVTPKVENREQLEQSLRLSFSFPLRITDAPTDNGGDSFEDWLDLQFSNRWTAIFGKHPRPFAESGSCSIDPRPLGAALQSQKIERLTILVHVRDTNNQLHINGSRSSGDNNFKQIEIDLRDPVYFGVTIKAGYDKFGIAKAALPLIGLLLLPMLLTISMNLTSRKLYDRPAELWGRHLRFLNRLIGGVWLVWLCVYSLSGMESILTLAIGRESVAQFVNVLCYFVPPAVAMFLCHFVSRNVYRHVTGVKWSPSEVVKRAMLVNILSLAPLFILVLVLASLNFSLRQAVVYVILGSVGWMIVNHAFGNALGPKLHALTSGELRNRIFELAHRAGVLLKQIYVLPEERAQLSNAFARSDASVMITSSLLKNLSRREVDAIMAHELAHLQAKHPQRAGTLMIISVMVAYSIGLPFITIMGFRSASSMLFAVSIALGSLIVFYVSRRNERQADAIGISLTGDPEAFISGLAKLSRLNLVPLHLGSWGESLETHPNTMRRLQSIAKAHQISNDRFEELINEPLEPSERMYPAIEEDDADEVIFSSDFKKKYSMRYAMIVLATSVLLPLPFAALVDQESVSGVWWLAFGVAGLIASFGIYQVVRNAVGFWGNNSLSRSLRARLEKRGLGGIAREGTFVGLSPASHSRKYENYQFWDIGLLWLTDEKLYYLGEQTEFALTRDKVHDVYVEDLNPEWLPEKSLFIRWQGAGDVKETFHFLTVAESSVLRSRRAIDALQKQVETWRYQPYSFPCAPESIGSIGEPVFPDITSEPAVKNFEPRVLRVALLFAYAGAVMAFAFDLSWLSIGYAASVVFAGTVLDELPKAFKPAAARPQPVDVPNYQPGSWTTENRSTDYTDKSV